MTLSEYSEISTIVGGTIVIIQLAAGLFVYLRQTSRDRIISTLEYYEAAHSNIKLIKSEMSKERLRLSTSTANRDPSVSSKKLDNLATKLLNAYERFATGVNLGIYDLRTVNRLCGKVVINTFNRHESMINTKDGTQRWTEFSKLCTRLRKLRGVHAKPGQPVPSTSTRNTECSVVRFGDGAIAELAAVDSVGDDGDL